MQLFLFCVCTVSDQESEPAAAEDAPVKLQEELKRVVSQATQTAADVTDVANKRKVKEGDGEQTKEESAHVQITASLSEVRYM